MSVVINKTAQGYLVNGKSVYQNSDNQWVEDVELTSAEKKEFLAHLNSL